MGCRQHWPEAGFSRSIWAASTRRFNELVVGAKVDPILVGIAMRPVMNMRSLVSVIDDDESVRESLPHLLKGFGFAVGAFSSAEEFLASDQVSQSKCLVVDINMPGTSGPDLLDELKRLGWKTPVIFITAQRDEKVRSQVLEQGAIACLFKPFSGKALRAALDSALGSG